MKLPSWVRPSGQAGARPGVLGACPRPPTGGGGGLEEGEEQEEEEEEEGCESESRSEGRNQI